MLFFTLDKINKTIKLLEYSDKFFYDDFNRKVA